MKTYESNLLEGYEKRKTICFSDKARDTNMEKIGILAPSVIFLISGFLLTKMTAVQYLTVVLLIPFIPAYIILHEAIHGAVYQLLTGQKFQIGRGKQGFYCILPQIYVYSRTQMLCAAAPLVVLTLLLVSLNVAVIINGSGLFLLLSLLLAFHFFACRGDIYLIKELYSMKDDRLLICEDEDGNNVVFGSHIK